MRNRLLFFSCLLAGVVAACGPAPEWRTMPLPELGLGVSLPCKPERSQRSVDLAGQSVQMTLQSCEAAGTTFAVACAALDQPSTAGAALAHWRAAVLAAAHATEVQDQPFQPPGTLGLPQAVRTEAKGALPAGGAMHVQAVWFARLQQGEVRACHAMVYGGELPRATADVFFESLVLQ